MDLSQVYGGDSLKAADLQGREIPVVISEVQMKAFDNGKKLIINFQGKKKALICNRTNANRIAYLYGTDTDRWIGKEIVLFADLVDFQGRTVEAIRIRPPANRSAAPTPAPKHIVNDRGSFQTSTTARPDPIEEMTGKPTRDPARDSMDEEIPF